jgi:hypothetical protein
MQHLEVSCAVRHIYIYIYVVRHLMVNGQPRQEPCIWSWSRTYGSNTVRCLRKLSLRFSANFTGALREPRCGHPSCRVLQAHSFFMVAGLSIFCLVVLCFSCRLDCTPTLAWECVYLSSLIHLVPFCLYDTYIYIYIYIVQAYFHFLFFSFICFTVM